MLEQAQVYWLSSVRPDGRPHVTTMAVIWLDEALYFSTGPSERKARNLAGNARCAMTTGCNSMYGDLFGFTVRDGRFHARGAEDEVLVFELAPMTAFAFGKGTTFSQTRWRFLPSPAYGVPDD